MSTPPNQQRPEFFWIEADAAHNPWGVRVLDVRPLTQTVLSMSQNPLMAQNAASYGQDDGTDFIGQKPESSRVIDVGLTYKIDGALYDGALFIPEVMEHKWAIYYHQHKIILIRSWMRQVSAVADVRVEGDHITIERLQGLLIDEKFSPEFTVRLLDYLIRTHVLMLPFPVPLTRELASDNYDAAMWCFSAFGKVAIAASIDPVPFETPDTPLRSSSLLHMAARDGHIEKVKELLERGVPVDLFSQAGLPPMHWVMANETTAVADLLRDYGSSVDVRTLDGITPLMTAIQYKRQDWVAYFINHGADVNAADSRGFTALHRAAVDGNKTAVELLLGRGANPLADAQGYTPISVARAKEHHDIVRLLEQSSSGPLN